MSVSLQDQVSQPHEHSLEMATDPLHADCKAVLFQKMSEHGDQAFYPITHIHDSTEMGSFHSDCLSVVCRRLFEPCSTRFFPPGFVSYSPFIRGEEIIDATHTHNEIEKTDIDHASCLPIVTKMECRIPLVRYLATSVFTNFGEQVDELIRDARVKHHVRMWQ